MPPVPASDHASPIRESISESRFSSLRGVRWRIDLGILPKSPASIDDIRRVAADSRRRYAHLRRRLIVDPHLSKDESKSPDLIVDNPLSQSPGEVIACGAAIFEMLNWRRCLIKICHGCILTRKATSRQLHVRLC